jgi:hypothetical protein
LNSVNLHSSFIIHRIWMVVVELIPRMVYVIVENELVPPPSLANISGLGCMFSWSLDLAPSEPPASQILARELGWARFQASNVCDDMSLILFILVLRRFLTFYKHV